MRVVITTGKHENGGIPEPLDLRENPRAIANIDAARQHPALGGLLVNLNSEESPFCTLGCKVWSSTESAEAEPDVFTSRIDLSMRAETGVSGQSQYEDLARRLAELLEREPGDALRVELRIAPTGLPGQGYSLRLVLCACGKGEQQARLRWTLGIARLQQALLFLARAIRQNR